MCRPNSEAGGELRSKLLYEVNGDSLHCPHVRTLDTTHSLWHRQPTDSAQAAHKGVHTNNY
jgi:hypothetical protein